MQSQIWGDCVALANSPYHRVHDGMKNFTNLGIPPSKLVLGVPWYGYDYQCLSSDGDDVDMGYTSINFVYPTN
jgi:di-N-acetylchitobiase